MSWILGAIGKSAGTIPFKMYQVEPIVEIKQKSLYIAAGGIPSTCLHDEFAPPKKVNWLGWIVAGLGMKKEEDTCSFYSNEDWTSVLSVEQPDISSTNGHFVALRYSNDEIQFFTDQTGLRTLYIASITDGILFSTRLDWIAQITGRNEVDLEAFGPQWVALNQISCWSPIRGIHRLGPGSRASCSPTSFKFQDTMWIPKFDSSERDFVKTLKPFLIPRDVPEEKISFGLSGGLDSRFLLALYQAMGKTKMQLHVFGDVADPDVTISKAIAQKLHRLHFHDQYAPQTPGELLSQMREYLAQIYVTSPASTVLSTTAIHSVARRVTLLLDASWAELARRQLFSRLFIKGRKALRLRTADGISKYITYHRADIFNPDATEMMKKGIVRQMQWYVDETTSNTPISNEEFVDLLAVRTRFPNYSGIEQARTDAFILSYMPFVQPCVIRSVFRIPESMKRKGKLFRQTILENCPELLSFPLVKGGTTYPFWFSNIPAHFWTMAKKKIFKPFIDSRLENMFEMLREYIQDLVHSQEFLTYPLYDVQRIQSSVERYYSGEHQLMRDLDWWLSFEFWRQSLKKNV